MLRYRLTVTRKERPQMLRAGAPLVALVFTVLVAASCQGGASTATTVELAGYRLSEIPAWGFSFRGATGWLVSRSDGGVDAFWARSPYLGCAVYPISSGERFEGAVARYDLSRQTRGVFFDPCGNSLWLFSGERIFGPTPRGLDRFDATLEARPQGDVVTIDFGTVALGACSPGVEGEVQCSLPGESAYVDGPRLYDWP